MDEKKSFPTPRGAAANKAKAKYNAKTYDQILVYVPKGTRAKIDESASLLGFSSRNEFIMNAIRDKLDSCGISL